MCEEDIAEFMMGALIVPPDEPIDVNAVYRALDNHRRVIFLPRENVAPSDDLCKSHVIELNPRTTDSSRSTGSTP